MGSLITLLAVADILGNNTAAVATYSKRLVLTALMGEPWGFMGSKRLLWEMYNDVDTTTGLNLDLIEQVWPTASCHQCCYTSEHQHLQHCSCVLLLALAPGSICHTMCLHDYCCIAVLVLPAWLYL